LLCYESYPYGLSCRTGLRPELIRAIALENHRSPSNPLGVKGAGEGAIIPIGGLMANAVANALASFGAMPNELPLSPARVWHMGSAKQSTGTSE
jgi:CO/xanthine dehydrogenase Mo-binding subunit